MIGLNKFLRVARPITCDLVEFTTHGRAMTRVIGDNSDQFSADIPGSQHWQAWINWPAILDTKSAPHAVLNDPPIGRKLDIALGP